MTGNSNAWTPDANKLAALSGRGQSNLVAPTYAATMTIDPVAGLFQQITATGDATLNANSAGLPGQALIIECAASGGTRTFTFGTNFRPSGTAAPTVGTSIVVAFVSNGTDWMEFSRSVSALAA